MSKKYVRLISLAALLAAIFISCTSTKTISHKAKPNIIFIFADDWSFPHAGVYGDTVVKTPHFDKIAQEGILFDHAFVSAPSCTPSRAAVLTGQHFWRLKEGANLYGPLRPEFPVYTDLLEQAGYHVGFSGKGWGPGDHVGRPHNPAGERFESFKDYVNQRPANRPMCFWMGSSNPHRGYKKGSGEAAGINPSKIQLSACFPESEFIRKDVADYYKEVQDFDDEIGAVIGELERMGELDNSLIVVSSDNGMPFPRCKSNAYDMGARVPLAIRWGNPLTSPLKISELVSLTDLAPTFLEVAGLPIPAEMTGNSLLDILSQGKPSDPDLRKQVFFGKERHVPGQELGDWGGYPTRAIRTQDYLYVKNYRPDRWPAGTADYMKSTMYPAFYADVDGGPTRTYMLDQRNKDPQHALLYSLAFEKRPAEELYHLTQDPDQLNNVAGDSEYTQIKQQLAAQLEQELLATQDPRALGDHTPFETYPYTGGTPMPDNFRFQNRNYRSIKIEDFPSRHIGSRTVEVLVPVNTEYKEKFSVLYMFDGQNLFDEFRGWGGDLNKGWRVDEVLNKMNQEERIPPIIVVGIYNSESRMSEYMPQKPRALLANRIATTQDEWYKGFQTETPQSDRHLTFVVEELKPYIDEHFKTKPGQANTFVGGSSMGGLLSAYAICEYPQVFGGAACFSTHWPPLEGVFLEYIKNNLPDPATHKIYFDHGTEGLDEEYEPFQKIADQAMRAKGYVQGKNWITRTYQGAKHHEDDWHARFDVPMEFLFSDK